MPCGALPVVGGVLMSPFGQRRAGAHYGIDLRAPEGAPVNAVLAGTVRYVASNGELERYGRTVVVDHGASPDDPIRYTLYAHLREVYARPGEQVDDGERIGTVGRTAGTRANPDAVFAEDPAHLHLEFLSVWPVVQGGTGRVDPKAALAALRIVVPADGPIFSACGEQSGMRVARRAGTGALLVLALAYGLSRL